MSRFRSLSVKFFFAIVISLTTELVHAEEIKVPYVILANTASVDNQRADFNRSLKRLGFTQEFAACKVLITLRQQGQDESFGGICALGGSPVREVLVCDDSMVGKFTIKASGFVETAEEIAAFTQANCPGGG